MIINSRMFGVSLLTACHADSFTLYLVDATGKVRSC